MVCGRDCCDAKRCTGKFMVWALTIIFGLGVVISTLSPNWIQFEGSDPRVTPVEKHEVEWGPFYGQYRTCVEAPDSSSWTCSKWKQQAVDLSDCERVQGTDTVDQADQEKLCRHLATFRSTGVICLILVFIGGCLVMAASCCQVITCGCCGNSLTCLANLAFWMEVALSIVTWSFAISSLSLINSRQGVTSSSYQWGFWVFIVFGTILGAMAAWMADWASEDSCLRGAWRCATCHSCRKKDNSSANNDNTTPLIGEDSA